MLDLAALKAVLLQGPPLRLAVLFGSAARGRLRPTSDVDVAVLPADPSLPLADELALQASLVRVLRREVDLVRLDDASPVLKWRIATEGQLLYEQRPFEHARFVANTASEYLDFAPALDAARERFLTRLARGARP